jgi:hypothetical protein
LLSSSFNLRNVLLSKTQTLVLGVTKDDGRGFFKSVVKPWTLQLSHAHKLAMTAYRQRQLTSFGVALRSSSLIPLAVLDTQLARAPKDGELRRQIMAHHSIVGGRLYDVLLGGTVMPPFKAEELIAIVLLKILTRKATRSEIVQTASSLPYFQRVVASKSHVEHATVQRVLDDIANYLVERKVKFDVHLPPDGHLELRSMPGASQPDAIERWLAKVGIEIAEEEDDPLSERYQDEYTSGD